MTDQTHVLELIEGAARDLPFCEHCGAPTVPVARDGQLWLECASIGQTSSRLRRLLSLDIPKLHTQVLLAELGEETAA